LNSQGAQELARELLKKATVTAKEWEKISADTIYSRYCFRRKGISLLELAGDIYAADAIDRLKKGFPAAA